MVYADMIVPSLVPTMVKSKKMNESKTASITQVTSKAILTYGVCDGCISNEFHEYDHDNSRQ